MNCRSYAIFFLFVIGDCPTILSMLPTNRCFVDQTKAVVTAENKQSEQVKKTTEIPVEAIEISVEEILKNLTARSLRVPDKVEAQLQLLEKKSPANNLACLRLLNSVYVVELKSDYLLKKDRAAMQHNPYNVYFYKEDSDEFIPFSFWVTDHFYKTLSSQPERVQKSLLAPTGYCQCYNKKRAAFIPITLNNKGVKESHNKRRKLSH